MEIIEATHIHVSGIVNLWKELTDFHTKIDPFFTRNKKGHIYFKTYITEQIEADDAYVVVCVDKGEVVGFVVSFIHVYPPLFLEKTCGFISDIAVTSEYQRKGIGSALLEKVFRWFAAREITRVELRVASQNQIGYAFWKKHGFTDYMHVLYKEIKMKPNERMNHESEKFKKV